MTTDNVFFCSFELFFNRGFVGWLTYLLFSTCSNKTGSDVSVRLCHRGNKNAPLFGSCTLLFSDWQNAAEEKDLFY